MSSMCQYIVVPSLSPLRLRLRLRVSTLDVMRWDEIAPQHIIFALNLGFWNVGFLPILCHTGVCDLIIHLDVCFIWEPDAVPVEIAMLETPFDSFFFILLKWSQERHSTWNRALVPHVCNLKGAYEQFEDRLTFQILRIRFWQES
jgi:hypothetical protein